MKFGDIPGHEQLKKTLLSSVRKNHMAHAQLFHGNEGGASLALVLAFASYILCENKQEDDSCGTCPSCHKVAKLIHPDVHFFFPKSSAKTDASKQNLIQSQWREFLAGNPFGTLEDWLRFSELENKQVQISKEEARNLIKTISLKSFEGNHKIIIMWYPESMNGSAANAILKVLEEPPEKTIYLMASYDLERIISTITSRTQLIAVRPFSNEEVANFLISEGVADKDAQKISRVAEGSIQKGLNIIGHSNDLAHSDFQDWMRNCLRQDYTALVKASEEFSQIGRAKQQSRLNFAIELIREAVLAQSDGSKLHHTFDDELVFIQKFSSAVPLDGLEKMYKQLSDALYHLERNANPRITHLNLSLTFSRLLKR